MSIECNSCGGTGLYSGFAEKKGTAVVCLSCDGSGEAEMRYKPFSGRRAKRGIHTVSLSRGSFLGTGVGGRLDTEMTYQQFKDHRGGFYK
jgi:hypothetical protein